MSTKKYVSLDKLSIFLNNLKNVFALKNHNHPVDSALSDTSTNPVQNKVLNAEFDAIADGMGVLEAAIDDVTSGSTTVAKASEATHATSADTATSATKASQDVNGNVIVSTYETKNDASTKLTEAKSYADTVAAGKADSDHTHNWVIVSDAKPSTACLWFDTEA